MSRSARSPAFSVSGSAAASASTCRQICCSRRRLSCSCLARTCWCSLLLLFERRHRALQPLGGQRDWPTHARAARRHRGAGRATARRLPRAAASEASNCSSSVASVSSRPAAASRQHPAALAILERAAGVLEPARQRCGVSDGIGGSASHCTFSSAIRSMRVRARRAFRSRWHDAQRDRPARARAAAARSSFRRALLLPLGDRFAHGLGRRVELLRRAPRRRRHRPATRPRRADVAASAVAASSGSGNATSASA